MNTTDGIIEAVRPGRRYVVTCDVDVPSRIWLRERDRVLPSALIMIPIVALLGLALALVGLAAVSMDLPRLPAETAGVDTGPAKAVPINQRRHR